MSMTLHNLVSYQNAIGRRLVIIYMRNTSNLLLSSGQAAYMKTLALVAMLDLGTYTLVLLASGGWICNGKSRAAGS